MKHPQSNLLATFSEQSVLRFKGIYFLVGFVVKLDRQNIPYAEIRISDATASQVLYCRDQACIEGNIQPNTLVHIEGRLEHTGKRPYFSCKYIGACSSQPLHFQHLFQLPSWLCRTPTALSRLIALVESIHDNDLNDFVCSVLLHKDVAMKYLTCPASQKEHHAYKGGLLEHSIDVATNFAATKSKKTIQYDLAVVAGLLHMVGVTRTLTSDLALSDVGNLYDHDLLTLEVCEQPLLDLFKKNSWAALQLCQLLACTGTKSGNWPQTQLAKQLQQHVSDSILNHKFNAINSTN